MDVRVGGTRTIEMQAQTPDGPMQMWFTGEYREVVDRQRLVYTESHANEGGQVISAGPTEVVVELHDLGDRTRMVMTHIGIPADSPGATGWAMAFDALASHLATST
jgi:uncharacterized protein YndB with AHSA1/START domain